MVSRIIKALRTLYFSISSHLVCYRDIGSREAEFSLKMLDNKLPHPLVSEKKLAAEKLFLEPY